MTIRNIPTIQERSKSQRTILGKSVLEGGSEPLNPLHHQSCRQTGDMVLSPPDLLHILLLQITLIVLQNVNHHQFQCHRN